MNKRPYLSFFHLICCSYRKTVNKQLIFSCYKFCLVTLSSKGTHFFDDISLIGKKSAFYETSTYCNCAKINSARKYEFGQCAKINGAKINRAKIGGARKKMGLR